jgi:hypothetical protein
MQGIDFRGRILIHLGAIALLWALWLVINYMNFNAANSYAMQVIFHCTHFLQQWYTLERLEHRDLFFGGI